MENNCGQIALNLRANSINIVKTSEEPLDLRVQKNHRHREKENGSSGQSNKRQKVTAKLWQTREVMRPEESLLRLVLDIKPSGTGTNTSPGVALTPESLAKHVQSNNKNQKTDHTMKDVVSANLPEGPQPPKKRNRFTITQLLVLEKVFEVKMFLIPREIQEVARLLDVEDRRVKIWFLARRQKWKKANDWKKKDDIRVAAFARQSSLSQELETSSSSHSTT